MHSKLNTCRKENCLGFDLYRDKLTKAFKFQKIKPGNKHYLYVCYGI